MKKIRQKMKAHYPDSRSAIDLGLFINFEMALTIVHRFAPEADPQKGYLMFTKYEKIGKKSYTPEDYLLQAASVCLRKYRSQKIWTDVLQQYQKAMYDPIRLFEFTEDKIVKRNTGNLPYGDRERDYLEYILSWKPSGKTKYAGKGTYTYDKKVRGEDKKVMVTFPEEYAGTVQQDLSRAVPREKIVLTIDQLIRAAEEMKQKKPGDHCAEILKKNLIQEVKDGKVQKAEKLEIHQVVNLAGMVGAGKTTLLKVMAYQLEKMGKHTVIVTDTVANVFQMYQYFHALGCDCSPLVGKSDRIRYINQLIEEDAYYLNEEISSYLTPACLVDGMDAENEEAVTFGKEPCARLAGGNGRYLCPYFNHCAGTAMQREALERKIVITTVQGMALCRVGEEQKIFLEEILKRTDVVFYDECDRVQKTLDEMFTPATEFDKFIRENADDVFHFMRQPNENRMRKTIAEQEYARLQGSAPSILACVVNAVHAAKECGNSLIFSNTFSAYGLLDEIKDSISEKTSRQILQLMNTMGAAVSPLYNIMVSSCERIENDRFEAQLSEWLDQNEPGLLLKTENEIRKECAGKTEKESKAVRREVKKQNQERIAVRKKIELILTLIYFDRFVREIGAAWERMDEVEKTDTELVGFIQSRYQKQQEYLPSAPMGNLFGIMPTQDEDIILFRQYAYGRTLLTDLPYLRINEKGEGTGPHVVLMSGSSYAAGSFEYHVNAEVNYIIEAEPAVRDFIARTTFVDMGLEERVSGSSMEEKDQVLRKVVGKCTNYLVAELQKEGKILLIVNSFDQAQTAAKRLRENFAKQQVEEEVCVMVSDQDEEERNPDQFIRRGEVYKFDQRQARILVAPALAIERGYNIVDEMGHSSLTSVFFLIRPMPVPDDVREKGVKLNGYIAAKAAEYKGNDLYEKNLYLRKIAAKFWNRMNRASRMRLDYLEDTEIKTDLVAMMFVLILQIFGRLCRVTDPAKNPPTVYFADGAFRRRADAEEGFDTLQEFERYLKQLFSDPESGEIARTLYEPFFIAYERGIKE